MKNYDEMTETVIRRRDAYAARQKRNRRIACAGIAAVAACLACVIALRQDAPPPITSTLSGSPLPSQTAQQTQPPTAPTEKPEKPQPQLTFLAHTANAVEITMEENIALPLTYYIGIADIRSLDTEDQIRDLMNQCSAEIDSRLQQLDGGSDIRGICHSRVLRRENYIISTLRCGSFQLCLDQTDTIDSITVETSSGYGEVTVHQGTFDDTHAYNRGFHVHVDASTLSEGPLLIDWMYSTALLEALEANPTVPLTAFSDTITVTVAHKDGTAQSCTIDLTINEDGTIWAMLRTHHSQL